MNSKIDKNNEYFVRFSEHIEEDLDRNWSSWNFGEEGFEGSKWDLQDAMNESIEDETSFDISGMELWGDDIKNADIRELYPNYWVLVDNVNAEGGLSAHYVADEYIEEVDTIEDLVALVKEHDAEFDGTGDGCCMDSRDVKLIWSDGWMNIFSA